MIDLALTVWQKLINWVGESLADPDDTDNMRVRKIAIGLVALASIPANFAWSLSYIIIGGSLGWAGYISLFIGLVYLGATVFLYRTQKFGPYLNIIAAASLTLYVVLQISFGGFMNSGLIIVDAFMIPLLCSLILGRWNTILLSALSLAAYTALLAFDGQISANPPELPGNFSLVNGFFGYLTMTVFGIGIILYLIRELEKAQEAADSLMFNILPAQIARRLKKNPGVIVQAHDQASILFADIAGFTPLTTKLPPEQMIDLLDRIYSHFDALVEKYGVEKIRTIGDNYMAVAGAPLPHPQHAQSLAHMALDMIAYARSMAPIGDVQLNFRIGINSGPLVGGVIGSKRTHYDVWGDAVNTASRMESHGEPGTIQVTGETYRLLAEDFVLEPRGVTQIKGKGEMETWFVVGRKSSA